MLNRIVNVGVVEVIDDGVIISPDLGGGRPIPSIIIDASKRPDIKEYIEAHRTQPPGDVNIQWGTRIISRKEVLLIIRSARPVETEFAIKFDADRHHALIDGVMCAKGFFLQTGNVGDKISTLIDKARITVEVAPTGFEKVWEKILHKTIMRKFKKSGISKREIKIATKDYIGSMREFWHLRRH